MDYYLDGLYYSPTEIAQQLQTNGGLSVVSLAFLNETLIKVRESAAQRAKDFENLTAQMGQRLSSENWTAVLGAVAAVGSTIPNPYTLLAGQLASIATIFTNKNTQRTRTERQAEAERQTAELREFAELEKQTIAAIKAKSTTLGGGQSGGFSWVIWAVIVILLVILFAKK